MDLRNARGAEFGPSFQEAGVGAISSAQKATNAVTPEWMFPPRRVCPSRKCSKVLRARWAGRTRSAWEDVLPRQSMPRSVKPGVMSAPSPLGGCVLSRQSMLVEITLGVLRSRSPSGRARRPGGPCNMGVRLGALGAHSLKLSQPSSSLRRLGGGGGGDGGGV